MGGTTSPGPGGVQPSLQGVKVPDENLTPQQRQHREGKLQTLTKMRQMLFPEQQKDMTGGPIDPTQVNAPGSLCPTGSLPQVSAPNQCGPMDWQKLQHPFMDGKKVCTFLCHVTFFLGSFLKKKIMRSKLLLCKAANISIV